MSAPTLPRVPVRTLIVDDHAIARDGVQSMLEQHPAIDCVGLAGDAATALKQAERTQPDVVVLDPQLADGSGIALCMQLKSRWPQLAVVIYSDVRDDELAVAATVAGADAFVDQADALDALPTAVLAAAAGEVRSPAASANALAQAGGRLDADDLPILGMLVHRTPPAEIAEALRTDQTKITARRWRMIRRLMRRDERPEAGRRRRRRTRDRTVPPRPPRWAT